MNRNRRGVSRERIYSIIRIGNTEDIPSRVFDAVIALSILLNLFIIFFETFEVSGKYLKVLSAIELITVLIFTAEYALRIFTADLAYPDKKSFAASVVAFVLSVYGIVDLVSFLPYWLALIFPASIIPQGAVAFRMLRVVRILRLFRINRYYDAFNVITDVLKIKKNQIASAVFIMLMLVIGASLIMYDIEHPAQPDKFQNAFSGIWWAVSTMLTVGYGDIYPITDAGRLVGIILAFLGVGIVAIPTGIISAGFVQQYSRIKDLEGTSEESPVGFISVVITAGHEWCKKTVSELQVVEGTRILAILRDHQTVFPSDREKILEGDRVIIGSVSDNADIAVEEIKIGEKSEWCNMKISAFAERFDVVCVLIIRNGERIVPTKDSIINSGDSIIVLRRNIRGIM